MSNSPIYDVPEPAWPESQSWEDCDPQHPYIQTSEFVHSQLDLHGDNTLYLAPEDFNDKTVLEWISFIISIPVKTRSEFMIN